MGPYFTTAYIAKAIEVALIVTLAIDFARHDGSPIAVVRRELAAFSSLVGRRGTAAGRRLVPDRIDTRSPTDMKRLTLTFGLLALAAVLAACSGASAGAPTARPHRPAARAAMP